MNNLDLNHIRWSQLPGFDNFDYCVLSVDRPNKLVDVLFHFHENDPIVLHRHCAVNHTFVISGEHRMFHANGDLKEARPTGSYTISQPDTPRTANAAAKAAPWCCSAFAVPRASCTRFWMIRRT